MEKLHELESDFDDAGLRLEVRGLEGHKQLSGHSLAARKRAMTRLCRVTVVAEDKLEEMLTTKFVEAGASGYTAIPCHGAGRAILAERHGANNSQIRLEAVVPREVAERILDYLRADIVPDHRVTACMEIVEVLRQDNF
jgi:hypothetical protein